MANDGALRVNFFSNYSISSQSLGLLWFVRNFVHTSRLKCPPRKDEADWLVEIAGEANKMYRMDPLELASLGIGKVPESPEEFHERWRASEGGKLVEQVRHHLPARSRPSEPLNTPAGGVADGMDKSITSEIDEMLPFSVMRASYSSTFSAWHGR